MRHDMGTLYLHGIQRAYDEDLRGEEAKEFATRWAEDMRVTLAGRQQDKQATKRGE